MEGVVRTIVGYTGGTKKDPSYHSLGDHTESIQIEYDPLKISYERLLEVFWSSHSPVRRPWSRQYMSIIFYRNEQQRKLAEESKTREEKKTGHTIFTEIRPLKEFYPAEPYHQKYYLRQEPTLFREYSSIYPDPGEFAASTAVARVNGFLGGFGTKEELKKEIVSLGLSKAGAETLTGIVSHSHRLSASCPL